MVTLPKKTTLEDAPSDQVRFHFFSELLKRPVCAGSIRERVGRLTDLVFAADAHYPEIIGIYVEHGWGKPTEFIRWNHVLKIEDDGIFVRRPADGAAFRRLWTRRGG